MIRALRIRNMALIEEVELEFGPGLNVLTGETGAGKTVIVGALGLLLGGRADAEMVRTGSEALEVEGIFEGTGLAGNDEFCVADETRAELLVRRVLGPEGRSRCSINSRLATVGTLAETAGSLVEIHGQHEHQRLMRTTAHAAYLDRFGGEDHAAVVDDYRTLYRRWSSLRRELDDLRNSEADRERQQELLGYQVGELEAVDEQEGEYDALLLARRKLQNAETLYAQISEAWALLAGDENLRGAADAVAQAAALTSRTVQLDPALAEEASSLEETALRLREASRALGSYREGVRFDQEELNQVEARLHTLAEMRRKYGSDYAEIKDFLKRAREKLALFENHAERLESLAREVVETESRMKDIAAGLAVRRRQLAEELGSAVDGELADLNMGGISFRVRVEDTGTLTESGTETVEFTVSSAPGEPYRPMVKIASGGELSRITLALKIVLAEADRVPILVFDEVDAGIGGVTSSVLGRKLARLARYHQVFCVTHLAQIASYADRQFSVSRETMNGSTLTTVRKLAGDERLEEIARMLGGESRASLAHARELLQRARAEKGEKPG